MKLCAIGLRGIPNVMGGIESHCQQLYPRLVREGMDVVVVARSPYVEKEQTTFEGVKVVPLWALKHKFFETFLHTFLAVFYARFVIKPDILHIHAIGPALFTPLARLLGMKVIVTHHGADYDRQKWNGFAKWLLKTGEAMAVKWAHQVIVVGQTLTNRLKAAYPTRAARINYVPNGTLVNFDADISEASLSDDLDIEPGNYILTVGRLVPEKGFHDLVSAFEKSKTPHKLVVVGNADHEDDYSRNLLKRQSERVIFAGRRQGAALNALYKYARVFVLPSYHEGLPIVALEAISADTQVIISDITPNKDIGLPQDCYFPVGNVEALAGKLDELETLTLSFNKSTFLSTFNWDTIAAETSVIAGNLTRGNQQSSRAPHS